MIFFYYLYNQLFGSPPPRGPGSGLPTGEFAAPKVQGAGPGPPGGAPAAPVLHPGAGPGPPVGKFHPKGAGPGALFGICAAPLLHPKGPGLPSFDGAVTILELACPPSWMFEPATLISSSAFEFLK